MVCCLVCRQVIHDFRSGEAAPQTERDRNPKWKTTAGTGYGSRYGAEPEIGKRRMPGKGGVFYLPGILLCYMVC